MKRCDRCEQLTAEPVRNRGEDLCWPCVDVEMRTVGVDIRVTNQSGTCSWIYNSVRDRDLAYVRRAPWEADGRDSPTHQDLALEGAKARWARHTRGTGG